MKNKNNTQLIAFQRIIDGVKYVVYAKDIAEANTLFNKLIKSLKR